MKRWTLPPYIIDNFSKVGTDYLQLTLDQSEKLVSEIIRNGEGITQKANIILGAAVTVLTLCVGAFIQILTAKDPNNLLITYIIFQGCFAMLAVMLLLPPLLKYVAVQIGAPPSTYLVENIIGGFENHSDRLRSILLSQCVNNQYRIDFNENENRRRIEYVDKSMFLLSTSPLLSLIISYGYGYLFLN